MAGRIRRGTLDIGGAVSNVSGFDWSDQNEFDRSRADDEFSGTPVEMSRKGSGSFNLLKGNVSSGYGTSDVVYTYKEIEVASGVEAETTKTATFTDVTFNQGGNVPAEGKGEIRITFEYSTCVIS